MDRILHDHLDSLLKLRRTCQRAGSSGLAVQQLLRETLNFVRLMMTDELYARAMKSAHEGEGLLLLANRLQMLEPLLSDRWPSDFTYEDLIADMFGIANGDAPRIIKSEGRQGKFTNAHALLEKKLDAHGWYKVLGSLKVATGARQSLIIDAYGIAWDAFNKWRKEAKDKLSGDYVERYLVSFVEAQTTKLAFSSDPVEWALEQTRQAGAAYKAELRSERL